MPLQLLFLPQHEFADIIQTVVLETKGTQNNELDVATLEEG